MTGLERGAADPVRVGADRRDSLPVGPAAAPVTR
jgi:hypothetical protein